MKDVQGAEDILYLFFPPAEESQAEGMDFVRRIFKRAEGRDTTPTLVAQDRQAGAIVEWGIRDAGKLARLAGIRVPTLVANGDEDVMVPTVTSYLLPAGRPPSRCSAVDLSRCRPRLPLPVPARVRGRGQRLPGGLTEAPSGARTSSGTNGVVYGEPGPADGRL